MERFKCLLFGFLLFSSFFLFSEDLPSGGKYLTAEELAEANALVEQILSENSKLQMELNQVLMSFSSVSGILASVQQKLNGVYSAQILSSQQRNDYEISLIQEIEYQKRRALRFSIGAGVVGVIAGAILPPAVERIRDWIRGHE